MRSAVRPSNPPNRIEVQGCGKKGCARPPATLVDLVFDRSLSHQYALYGARARPMKNLWLDINGNFKPAPRVERSLKRIAKPNRFPRYLLFVALLAVSPTFLG